MLLGLLRCFCSRRWWWKGTDSGVLYVDHTTTGFTLHTAHDAVSGPGKTRIVTLSDTHGFHRSLVGLPAADILIHCGDILLESSLNRPEDALAALHDFNQWLGELPYAHKLVVGGNHVRNGYNSHPFHCFSSPVVSAGLTAA